MPVPAGRPAAVLAAGALVAACGSSATPGSERWIALHPSTAARTEVAAARVGRLIYVLGGFLPAAHGGVTTGRAERYDIRRDRWSRIRPMPVALNHAAAVAYRGDVYVLGGYRARAGVSAASSALYRYDTRRRRWSRLPRAPSRRAALAAAVIGGRLYAAGGARAGRALRTLEIYDFARRRWSHGPVMPTAREHLAAAASGQFVYVLGGRAAGRGNFAVAERYDVRRRRWERLPDMPRPSGGLAAASVGRRIVAFGGEEAAGTIPAVQLYDPSEARWSRLADMRTPRHGLGAASLDGRIYAIEGGPRPGFAFSRALEALEVP